MPVRIVQLGTPRRKGEGLRIGAVRRPPRGVPKREYAPQNWYDVWLPDLAPSATLLKAARAGRDNPEAWRTFVERYRREMRRPGASRLIGLLAALSHHTSFSVGCYCTDESRCHRSVLRALLRAHGAVVDASRAGQ